MVVVETARVFRCADGRRYFTFKAALRHELIKRLKSKHPHDGCDDELRGGEHHQFTFYTSDLWEYFEQVCKRFSRLHSLRIRSAKESVDA